ncbi:SCO family protein [Alienimonas californiensis]|uniref:Thioredoxin domain-containing protein n=1 Tax=Alienimonas californiensis TaxID=2527989 RepID=A0A517PBT8_9PLAN|nr:SCO family protein [Alienimonas californiensis]QDT16848.1 hypothetical protein CA12_29560 [Alienimonas californiensis]
MTRSSATAVAALCGLLCPALASAQAVRPDRPDPNVVPFEVREVGVDEKLGAQVSADLTFRDHTGNPVRLGDYFDGTRPVILTLNYSRCPKICDTQLRNLATTLGEMELTAGDDYRIVTVSIDPSEGPEVSESRRRGYVKLMGKGNWSFLTGTPASIAKLTRTVGFKYKYVPETQDYHHAPVAILLTPSGQVGRYLHRLSFEPETLRFGMVETGQGTLGTTTDEFRHLCYTWDPERAAYVPRKAALMMAGAGFLFVVGFGGWLSWQWRHSRAESGDNADSSQKSPGVRREDARNGGPVNAPAAV